jgi:hypothetical protein
MKVTKFRIPTVIFLLILFGSLIGCAGKLNLVKNGQYSVEELDSDAVDISETEVYIENDTFIVYGRLRRIQLSSFLAGHVDVFILDSQGNYFDQVSVTHRLPFISYRRRNSSFKAHFQRIPPEGSTIRVGFHKEEFEEYEQFDCGENAAIHR